MIVRAGENAHVRAPKRPAWLKAFAVRHRREVACAIGLGLAASACAALLMFTSGYLISATALAGTTLFSIMVPVGCVQVFGFGRPLARYCERLASHDWVLRVTSDLRLALYRVIEARSFDPAQARATGEYLGLLADDVAHLQNLYLRVVFPTVVAYLLAIGAALLFGFFSPPFALVMALSTVLVIVALPLSARLATRASVERAKAIQDAEYVRLVDDARGSIDWILSGRGADARARHDLHGEKARNLEARVRRTQRLLSLLSSVLLALLACLVVAWAGDLFGTESANVNWVAAFALGFFPLIDSFAALPASFAESNRHVGSIARLDEYLGDARSGDAPHVAVAPVTDPDAAAVALCDVYFAYPHATRPALDGVTLSVPRGQSIAVLGRSGAGKSTLAALMCGRLFAQSGTTSVLGYAIESEGVDLSRLVSYIGQDPYLFNRSLRENLTLGAPDAPDERIVGVLADVGLGSRLAQLPYGLDTVIGSTGVGLSGGEAHRVALARALIADTPLVVVDEPFSALDPETEDALLETMLETCADRTLVVVTHHLARIERFDRVVFVEDARIDLDGSPADLLFSSARFRELVAFDRTEA